MVVDWSSSEKLKLLLLHKDGAEWPNVAEKLNDTYPERPKNFFNEKNCKAEFDRICNDTCPRLIAPDEPSQAFTKSAVIDAWITHLREQVNVDAEKMVEMGLVEMRRDAELIERIYNGTGPSPQEMKVMLEKIKAENAKKNRDPAQMERVTSAYRGKIEEIFKARRESAGTSDMTVPPASLFISPTKASSVALQPAFRSPSPLKSPIRPLAEAIEEADAEMVEVMGEEQIEMEEPKIEVETPVGSPTPKTPSSSGKREKEKWPTLTCSLSPLSTRAAVERMIGNGGLEEEREEDEEEEEEEEKKEEEEEEQMEVETMEEEKKEEEEEEPEEEEPVKDELMEVEESVVVEKPVERLTRKSTRVSTASVEATSSTPTTRRRKEASPIVAEAKKVEKMEEKEKEETKEEESRSRRSSLRSKAPAAAAAPAASPTSPVVPPAADTPKTEKKEKEETTPMTRRSSRVEKPEEKKTAEKEKEVKEEEGVPVKRGRGRKSLVEKEREREEKEKMEKEKEKEKAAAEIQKTEEKEVKEQPTFVAPTVATRTRHNRGSEQAEDKEKEKDKSEEPSVPKTRSGSRLSLSSKASSESKESPAPTEKKTKRGEKKEKEKEKEEEVEERVSKETSVALSERSLPPNGGKRDVEVETEISIRHCLVPTLPVSPSKARKGAERESSSTPLARKSSRVSSASSNSGKREALMVSVEVQTEKLEMKTDDELFVHYDSNEHFFHPVTDIGGWKRITKKNEKEIKTEEGEEKPVSRRTRGGDSSEDEGGSRSNSFSQSDKGAPSRRKDSKRDQMTVHFDVDDDTGRYLLMNGAVPADSTEGGEVAGPSSAKKSRTMESAGRRSIKEMDPLKHAMIKSVKELELNRHSSVFKTNVSCKDAPDYYDCVKFPVCISKLKSDVYDGVIKDPISLKKQIAIMFMNGAMYNSTAHDYWMYAVDMSKETYTPIRDMMPQVENEEEEEGPKLTRARRNNEPAFAKDAVRVDRERSANTDRYFKCESVDLDEAEKKNVEDVHRAVFGRSKVNVTRRRRI